MTHPGAAVAGIGLDVVSIDRLRRILTGPAGSRFGDIVFTPAERAAAVERHDVTRYCALAFATKEAVFKAFGTQWEPGDDLRDIALCEDAAGRPYVVLCGRLLGIASALGVWPAVSLSWEGDHAAAVAVLRETGPPG